MRGKLYLIPTTLGDNEPLEVMPYSVKTIVELLDHYIVENEKSARRFIKKITPKKTQSSLTIMKLDKYAKEIETRTYLDFCAQGISVGLLSEAGVSGCSRSRSYYSKTSSRKRYSSSSLSRSIFNFNGINGLWVKWSKFCI